MLVRLAASAAATAAALPPPGTGAADATASVKSASVVSANVVRRAVASAGFYVPAALGASAAGRIRRQERARPLRR